MPELPEVETVRRGLVQWLPKRRLDHVEFQRHDLRWPMPVDALQALSGQKCLDVTRRSKYLLMPFSGGPTALVHLGMSGRLFLDKTRQEPEWRKHEHWRMRFGQFLLRYVDPRRFGMLDLTDDTSTHSLLTTLGPEPLGDAFDAEYLFTHSRCRKVAIKVFLMDAKNVVGVGNIYASEACFRAGVRPGRAAGRITRAESEALVACVREVLDEAIEAGGTTLRDYVGVDEGSGYFQRELAVYGRDGETCFRCGGTIKRTVLGQRSTYYCPSCQS